MKRAVVAAVLISFFVGISVISSLAAAEHESHHPDGAQAAATSSSQGMMMQQGVGMNQMPCMAEQATGSKAQMMGMMGHGMGDMMGAGMSDMMSMMVAGKMGMIERREAHMFFLDHAAELGLSTEQVGQLQTLYSDCRKDNIRNAAEAKIARLELADLLAGEDWSLQEAESQVRKVQKLEGDIQIRYLKALNTARKVLTAEQLKQARSGDNPGNPDSLFQ